MPASGSSARRYAQAVFEIARERDSFDRWQEDLQALAGIASHPELAALLRNPRLPVDAKRQLLREALSRAGEEAVNLATLLVARGNLEALAGPIAAEYLRRLDEARGIVHAEVLTAVELEPAEETRITQDLAEATGKEVRLERRVDPSIVGGMVIRIGDQVVDGSISSRLKGLQRNLSEMMAG